MITLFGIKSCDSVRKAKKWMDEAAIEYQFHDFREAGLEPKKLNQWVSSIGWEKLLNTRSTSWRQLDAGEKQNLTQTSAKNLMLQNPTLIKRPVLEKNADIFVGFKKEEYESYFR